MTSRIISVAVVFVLSLGIGTSGRAADEKITYEDHVKPILREHCFACHNQNKATNDLALDSYEMLMEGGASGTCIEAGDPDSSYLWLLVSHQDEPAMPPNQDKLPDAKLSIIQRWIEGGALKDSGSTAAAAKPKVELAMTGPVGAKAEAIMPEGVAKQPLTVTSHRGAVTALAAAPGAPLAAVAGLRQICLYHLETGELLGILPFDPGMPYDLKFSRSGAVLAAGGGTGAKLGTVVLYDVRTGKEITRVGDEFDAVLTCDISPDQSFVVLGGPQRLVRVFNTADGTLATQIKKHTDWVYAAAVSPDGILMATADRSGGLWVWEAGTDREFYRLDGHKGAITDLAWRPDSNVLASCSEDGTVKLWNMLDGNLVRSINAHNGGVASIDFLPDGNVVSGGRDKTVKVWDASGKAIKTFPAFSEIVLEVTASLDGRHIIAGDWAGEVRVLDVESGKTTAVLSPYPQTDAPPATASP